MSKHYFLDLIERVISTFVEVYIGAVVVLPGGMWATHNWQIALAGSIAATVKAIVASRVGDKNTASIIPIAGATGAAAGSAVGSGIGTTIGGILDPIVNLFRKDNNA